MRYPESPAYSSTIRMDDDAASKDKKRSVRKNNLWEEDEYDESWDHIYDNNELENKRRRLDRSDKHKNDKQDW